MNLLAFGIHPDDVELGCGATVAKAAAEGHRVVLVDLTRGESSSNGTPEQRALEAEAAARALGVAVRENLSLPDTRVVAEDPEQVLPTVRAIRKHRPTLVLVPYRNDPHPDHASGARLVERALYLAGVHGYDPGREDAWKARMSWVYPGRLEFVPHVVVDVTDTFATKIDAVNAHRSQFDPGAGSRQTPLNQPNFLEVVEARAIVAGRRIGVRYGEGFKPLQPLALRTLGALD